MIFNGLGGWGKVGSPGAYAQVGNAIDYLEEMEAYPIPGLRMPLKISMYGWRAALIAVPLAIGLVIAGLLSWFLLTLLATNESPRTLLHGLLLTGVIGGWLPSCVIPSSP